MSTPAQSVPVEPAAEAAPADGDVSSTQWEDILAVDEDDAGDAGSALDLLDTSGQSAPAAPAATPAAPAASAPTAEAPPAAPVAPVAPAAPATPAPAAQAPTAPAAAPQAAEPPAAAPAAPALSPEARLKMRNDYIAEVAKDYAMSPDEEARFISSPNTVLPQLAARLRVDVVDQVVPMLAQYISQHLPAMIQNVSESTASAKTNEESFFGQWSELKDHRDVVQRVAQQWRQLNPQASREDAIREIGILAWQAARLPMNQLLVKMADPPKGAEVATAPVPIVPRAPTGFAPAPSAPAPAPASNVTVTKRWTDSLLEDIPEEDD